MPLHQAQETRCIAVVGDPDLDGWAAWLEQRLDALSAGEHVVVDLSRASRVDAAALAVLVRARRRLLPGGGEIELRYGDRDVLRVFQVTGLDRLFPLSAA
jgi:anti-sigma B factor antagonist